jgi:Cdc6-like AAA superfamily ATPase
MELVERLERHKSTCIMALAADEMSAMLEVLGQQKITNQQLAEIRHEQRKTNEIRLAQEFGEEAKKILNWLSPVDPLRNHQAARKIHQKGTCRWLIDSPEFIHWIKTKNSAIWLYGIPGAGKTILSSLVIEEVFSLQDNGVAFYYCDYKNATSQEPTNILGSMVRQLALQEARALAKVKDFYNFHHPAGRPSSRPTEQDFGVLLQDISKSFAEVTIILDGLDECGSSPGIERSELIRILSILHDEHAGSIRIAIASRQERDIEERFDEFTKVSIAAMSLDLELYVACEVERRTEARKLRIRDSSLKGEIIQALINGADGM